MRANQDVVLCDSFGESRRTRVSKIYGFRGNERVTLESASAGDVVAVAVGEGIGIGLTVADPTDPRPLPPIAIDPPTISMGFLPNDSPFVGLEGKFVTTRHIEERLRRETLSDVALDVKPMENGNGYEVAGRGELHLSILIERMRREGYEFQVSRPKVVFREEDGRRVPAASPPVLHVTSEAAAYLPGPARRRRMINAAPGPAASRTRSLQSPRPKLLNAVLSMAKSGPSGVMVSPKCGRARVA